tara:strand:+ start:10645 stop:10830 length:186 start_codon:yes stop_codon:yes gene_type:complete
MRIKDMDTQSLKKQESDISEVLHFACDRGDKIDAYFDRRLNLIRSELKKRRSDAEKQISNL